MPNNIHLLAGCDTADNAFTQYICTDIRIRARVETDVQYLSEGVIKHAKLILVCMHMYAHTAMYLVECKAQL